MGCFLKEAWRKWRNKSKCRSKETLRPTSPGRVDEASVRSCAASNNDVQASSATISPEAPSVAGPAPIQSSGPDDNSTTVVTVLPVSSCPILPTQPETTIDESTEGSIPTSSPETVTPTATSPKEKIWYEAYKEFEKREEALFKTYTEHLASHLKVETKRLNPDDIPSFVERLEAQRKADQSKFTFRGKEIIVRKQAEKVLKALTWGDTVVKSALSSQPHAALAWSGVSILLPLLTKATSNHAAMLDGFDSVQRILVYWRVYQDKSPNKINTESNADIWKAFVNLYSHIFEFQARVICHLSDPQHSRAWQKVAGWNEWKSKTSTINELNSDCKDLTNIPENPTIQRTLDKAVHEVYESPKANDAMIRFLQEERGQRRREKQDEDAAQLLENLAATHEKYKNFNPPKVEGTCGWLLEDPDFRSWCDRTESGLLFLFAGPGCGKSVLARSLIDDWQLTTSATTSMVCHFFFKDGDAKRIHSHDALAAILHQVFIKDLTGKFMRPALHRHKKYGEKLAENFDELWDMLLDCACTPDAGEIVCVLDAFDECLKDERDPLMTKLKDFFSGNGAASQRNCRLKFLITSRPYDTIESPLRRLLNTSCLRIDGGTHSVAISEDINRVIDTAIPKLLGYLSDDDKERVSDKLKAMENRTYLWLRLTFGIIEDNPSDYGRHTDVDHIIQKLPKGHAEAYETMLNKKCNMKFTRPLLQIILAAKQPLSLDEANIALAVAVGNQPNTIDPWPKGSFESHVKNFCGLLVDTHDSKVQFLHQTVREFLTEHHPDGKEWSWGGRFNPPEYHKTMARSCALYLSSPAPGVPLGESSDFHNTFFRYAAEHWTFHFRESRDEIDTELLQEARDLCCGKGKNLAWLTSTQKDLNWSRWSDLHIAALFGLSAVVRAIIEAGSFDTNTADLTFGAALFTASIEGFAEVVNVLLDHGADVNMRWDNQSSLHIASLNGHYAVARLLVDRCAHEIEITMADFVQAAYHFTQKEAESFLERMVDKLILTPESLAEACASSHARNAVALLAKYRGTEIQITPEMVAMAASNKFAGSYVMADLLGAWNDQISITPEILHAAAENQGSGDVMGVLLQELERRQVQIEVDERILIAAATNSRGQFIVRQLFERTRIGNQFTPRVVAAAAGNESAAVAIMGILFEKKGFQIEITPDVISAAEMNQKQGKWVLELIEMSRQHDKDPELILQEIAERQAQLIEERPWGPPHSSLHKTVQRLRKRLQLRTNNNE
ncbi:hypothetical protein KJ359_005060 [Pestalotiopsis sp. 9143b]|nr:hypothetical protein KJ359_005060 [Pestalotiopsis sp. 9143b]